MATVTLDGVDKRWPDGTRAVRDFRLEVEDGEFVVLVGPSGCGKTTLLRMIAGLESVTAGRIRFDGADVTARSPRERNVAMVFQNYALYPHMTVRGNLEFPLRMARIPKGARRGRVEETAAMLGLGELLGRRPAELSGGQSQRVAMGRALVREPAVFLMDEPLSNLDAKLRVEIRAEIASLTRRVGTTTIYVTHDQVEAMTLGDRIAVVSEGRLMQAGPPQDLYDRPANTFVARFLGSPGMNVLALRDPPPGAPPEARFLGVRPEDLHAVADADPAPMLTGEVEAIEALGHESLVHVRLADGAEMVVARLPASVDATPGHEIHLRYDATAATYFDSDERRVPDPHSPGRLLPPSPRPCRPR
jgi:ABC-type sugar transport system ATPase subunit